MSSTAAGSASRSPKLTHHSGRGGAGNVISKDAASPQLESKGTPTLKTKKYTTGRGGTGNMASNDFADESRASQDVDVPGIMLPEGEHHTGRGGVANKHKPSNAEVVEAKEHNERLRRDSFHRRGSKDIIGGIKGLADKGKEKIKGKSHDKAS